MTRDFLIKLDIPTANRVAAFAAEHNTTPERLMAEWVTSYSRTVGVVIDHELLVRAIMLMPPAEQHKETK